MRRAGRRRCGDSQGTKLSVISSYFWAGRAVGVPWDIRLQPSAVLGSLAGTPNITNPLRFLHPACFHQAMAPTKAPRSSWRLGTRRPSTSTRRLAHSSPTFPGHCGMETAPPRPPADPLGSGWDQRDLLKEGMTVGSTSSQKRGRRQAELTARIQGVAPHGYRVRGPVLPPTQ